MSGVSCDWKVSRVNSVVWPFDPADFIGRDWTVWRGPLDGDGLLGTEEMDSRSMTVPFFDLDSLVFETCLAEDETAITGEEKIDRLKERPELIRLGGDFCRKLWEDYEAKKEDSIVEDLFRSRGISYIDFPGHVLRGLDGYPCILYIARGITGEWILGYYALSLDCIRADKPSVLYSTGS